MTERHLALASDDVHDSRSLQNKLHLASLNADFTSRRGRIDTAFRWGPAVRRWNGLPADQPAVRAVSTRVGGTGATGRRRSCVAAGWWWWGGGNGAGWAVLISTQELERHRGTDGLQPDRGAGAAAGGCRRAAVFEPLRGWAEICSGFWHNQPPPVGKQAVYVIKRVVTAKVDPTQVATATSMISQS